MRQDGMDQRIDRNNILGVGFKCFSMILGVLSVRYFLSYLGKDGYGLWMTISSIASWAAMGDLGIGNGMKNELSKAYASGDYDRQQKVFTASISALVLLAVVVFFFLTIVSEILIYVGVIECYVRIPLYITNFFMCINFVLGLAGTASCAYQLNYFFSFSQIISSILNLLLIIILIACKTKPSIILFAVLSGMCTVFGNTIMIAMLRKQAHLSFSFSIHIKDEKEFIDKIIRAGVLFFLLQLCGVILYSTDNIIIKSFLGNESVTVYSIISKIYNSADLLFSIFLVNLWSAVAYQFSLNNISWIEEKIKKIKKIWLIYTCVIMIISFFLNFGVKIWIGNDAPRYSWSTIIIFSLFNIIGSYGAIYVNVANGMNIIKLQLVMCIIESLINIPLSFFLGKTCGLGINGVKIATFICCIGANLVMPIYINIILNRLKRIDDA